MSIGSSYFPQNTIDIDLNWATMHRRVLGFSQLKKIKLEDFFTKLQTSSQIRRIWQFGIIKIADHTKEVKKTEFC